jgi:hypothetical protein
MPAAVVLTFPANSHGECRRRPLPVEKCSTKTSDFGVVTNPACLHSSDLVQFYDYCADDLPVEQAVFVAQSLGSMQLQT